MKAKIDDLLEKDITQGVEGLTAWASPVVVASSCQVRYEFKRSLVA